MTKKSAGLVLYDEGVKYTKATLTRWTPDYHLAAAKFEQACVQFRLADDSANLARAQVAAASAYEQLHSLSTSAKFYGQAVDTLTKLGAGQAPAELRAQELVTLAASLYDANGQLDPAAKVLIKGAKLAAAAGHPDLALSRYTEAVAVFLAHPDKAMLGHDTVSLAVVFAVAQARWDAALSFLDTQAGLYLASDKPINQAKAWLAAVVVCLHAHLFGEAVTRVHEVPSQVLGSSDYEVGQGLLDAYTRLDVEALETFKARQESRLLPAAVARLVKGLSIPDGGCTMPVYSGADQECHDSDNDQDLI